MLPDQEKERGAALDPLLGQVSAVKDGGLLLTSALSPFVQQLLFGRQVDNTACSRATVPSVGTNVVQGVVGDRQGQSQRAPVLKLKAKVEQAAAQLEKDKQELQREKDEWEKAKDEEKRKLQRERMVLNKQSRAMLKLPTKKDRAEMEAMEATLAEERRTARAKEARHKLIVERLRRQIVELQEKNGELREELIGSAAGIVDLAATLTRPQRPPAKPLPPVPRFDRLDFGRGAGPAAAERRGDSAQLRVECSAASAPAVHHAALSPFLDDIGSEAVYSPLRASMRATGAHSSFFGSSRFNGAAAPRISRPPRSTQPARTASGLGLAAPGLLAHGSVPVQETRHSDGKVERMFGDGRRAVTFANGTLKEHSPDGRSVVIFTNGDVKRTFPDSTVEYFYAEVDTWHTTHPDGVEVFYFPSGQTETHHPSGLKEIVGADGLARLVHADGREEEAARGQLSRAAQRSKPSLDSEALAALRLSINSTY
ncbi:hypothetical protein WJX75_007616 [Coccomyxa subellipsoidea]|uniref:Centromere protein J C-terminal domain-containing protein n=1 Tax=Coccomyxa subellipsoidea TaxID=248742 RepID=A0ABR2Z1G1_9CHLO